MLVNSPHHNQMVSSSLSLISLAFKSVNISVWMNKQNGFLNLVGEFYLFANKNYFARGIWVAQTVKHWSLGFDSAPDLKVMRLRPVLALSSMQNLLEILSASASGTPAYAISLK